MSDPAPKFHPDAVDPLVYLSRLMARVMALTPAERGILLAYAVSESPEAVEGWLARLDALRGPDGGRVRS